MRSKLRAFLQVMFLGACWVGAFFAISRSNAPPTPKPLSSQTKMLLKHFGDLAKKNRQSLDVNDLYRDHATPGGVDAILEFTLDGPVPLRTIAIDGFRTKYVNVARGENDRFHVFAGFTRTKPYVWPRVLDVEVGKEQTIRADLDERLSADEVAIYNVNSDLKFELPMPKGVVTWEIAKTKEDALSPICLYRQDLYKDGEWTKTLVALLTKPDPTAEPPQTRHLGPK